MPLFPRYYWKYFCISLAERLQRPGGVVQAVAAEETPAAAERKAAGGAEAARGGQRLPLTQPRGV